MRSPRRDPPAPRWGHRVPRRRRFLIAASLGTALALAAAPARDNRTCASLLRPALALRRRAQEAGAGPTQNPPQLQAPPRPTTPPAPDARRQRGRTETDGATVPFNTLQNALTRAVAPPGTGTSPLREQVRAGEGASTPTRAAAEEKTQEESATAHCREEEEETKEKEEQHATIAVADLVEDLRRQTKG